MGDLSPFSAAAAETGLKLFQVKSTKSGTAEERETELGSVLTLLTEECFLVYYYIVL